MTELLLLYDVNNTVFSSLSKKFILCRWWLVDLVTFSIVDNLGVRARDPLDHSLCSLSNSHIHCSLNQNLQDHRVDHMKCDRLDDFCLSSNVSSLQDHSVDLLKGDGSGSSLFLSHDDGGSLQNLRVDSLKNLVSVFPCESSGKRECWWWFKSHALRCTVCKSCPQDKDSVINQLHLHDIVYSSGLPNFKGCRIPVHSNINIAFLRENLVGYHDYLICEFLEFGFPLGMEDSVYESFPSLNNSINHLGAKMYPDYVLKYLCKEKENDAVIGPFRSNPFDHVIRVSPLNTVPKRDGNQRRVILDLSWPNLLSVNDFISSTEYLGLPVDLSYPTVDSLVSIVKRKGYGCLMYKKDLSRAYRQLPVDPRDWGFLGYVWKSHLFFDTVLAMGLRSACMCCQRTTNAVTYIFKSYGFDLVNYIDDFAGAENSRDAFIAFELLGQLLLVSGLVESEEKSVPPSVEMVFLGVLLNSVSMTMSVVPERMSEILSLLKDWNNRVVASKKQVQSLLGKLVFIAACVRSGRIFVSRMLNFLRTMPKDQVVPLPYEFYKDVNWWRIFAPKYKGVSVMFLEEWSCPDEVAASDACLSGCGGICNNFFFHTEFPHAILNLNLHINALELLTIVVCSKLWGHFWTGKRIIFNCDNEVSVMVINSGKARDLFLQKCLREICFIGGKFDFQLRAQHIPGVSNRIPDLLSRWHLNAQYRYEFDRVTSGSGWQELMVEDSLFQFSHDW